MITSMLSYASLLLYYLHKVSPDQIDFISTKFTNWNMKRQDQMPFNFSGKNELNKHPAS